MKKILFCCLFTIGLVCCLRAQAYTPGNRLLNVPGRGHALWGQGKNNDDECEPSYNMHCADDLLLYGHCKCDLPLAGCGPVAMGQIMWYWQWPRISPNAVRRQYDWDLMPSELNSHSSIDEGDAVAYLLKDCGEECVLTYVSCEGTPAPTIMVLSAFSEFGYNGVKCLARDAWNPWAWRELIRSEIECGRPVFYHNDSLLFFNSHHFVIDGFDSNDHDQFYFNFGWPRSTNCNISHHPLNNIFACGNLYSTSNLAIVGISPTYNDVDIEGFEYDYVEKGMKEVAMQDIVLPTGESLEIGEKARYKLTAGRSIVIEGEFVTNDSSEVVFEVDPIMGMTGMEIVVPEWPTTIGEDDDGLYIPVFCANSFEFTAYRASDSVRVFQWAGKVKDDVAGVWYRENYDPGRTYICKIAFKNNYGRRLEHTFYLNLPEGYIDHVTPDPNPDPPDPRVPQPGLGDLEMYIYPNPVSDNLYVVFGDGDGKTIYIFNTNGYLCMQPIYAAREKIIDVSGLNPGRYVILARNENGRSSRAVFIKQD